MKKIAALKILNPIIALLLLCQAGTALLMTVLGNGGYEEIHEIGGILLVLGVLLHSILNWNWVKANY